MDIGNKTYRLLYLFDLFSHGGTCNKASFCMEHGMNPRTFDRDLAALRVFLSEISPGMDIVYDRRNRVYYLDGGDASVQNGARSLALAKILVSTGAFSKTELQDLLDFLSESELREHQPVFRQMLAKDRYAYTDAGGDKKLLDLIWNVSKAITQRQKLVIHTVFNLTSPEYLSVVYPVAILFSRHSFFLAYYMEGFQNPKPDIVRLDQLVRCNPIREPYDANIIPNWDYDELMRRIELQTAGHNMVVRFSFSGEGVNEFLGLLPRASITSVKQGIYYIEAEVYGIGFLMYLLSLGDNIQLIEPARVVQQVNSRIQQLVNIYGNEGV